MGSYYGTTSGLFISLAFVKRQRTKNAFHIFRGKGLPHSHLGQFIFGGLHISRDVPNKTKPGALYVCFGQKVMKNHLPARFTKLENGRKYFSSLIFSCLVAVESVDQITGFVWSFCVVSNGNAKCVGGNNVGQLGYGDSNKRGDQGHQQGNDLLNTDNGSVTGTIEQLRNS